MSCAADDLGTSVALQQITLETVETVIEPQDYWDYVLAVLGDTDAVQTVLNMEEILTSMGKVRTLWKMDLIT